MSPIHILRMTAVIAVAQLACTACAPESPPASPSTSTAAGCLTTGDGALRAQLRGALDADLAWSNAQMQCDGGVRPDGKGVRVTVAGPLLATTAGTAATSAAPRSLRFIFGIDLHDSAAGAAQVLPTNITVIVEGEQQLYATQGDDKCAVETLERAPIASAKGVERVRVRGYCTGPASDLAGIQRVLIPTFDFTALVHTETDL
jgi:hypothetical protein